MSQFFNATIEAATFRLRGYLYIQFELKKASLACQYSHMHFMPFSQPTKVDFQSDVGLVYKNNVHKQSIT